MNKILYLSSKFKPSRKKDQHEIDKLACVVIRSVHSAERASAFSVRHDRQVLRVIQSNGSQTSVCTQITAEYWVPLRELLT